MEGVCKTLTWPATGNSTPNCSYPKLAGKTSVQCKCLLVESRSNTVPLHIHNDLDKESNVLIVSQWFQATSTDFIDYNLLGPTYTVTREDSTKHLQSYMRSWGCSESQKGLNSSIRRESLSVRSLLSSSYSSTWPLGHTGGVSCETRSCLVPVSEPME